MEIKKFNELTESNDNYTPNEKKALKAGHKVGDTIFNVHLKKTLTIVRDAKSTRGREDLCTLGAVGENPTSYTKIEPPLVKDNYIQAAEINNIKNSILKLSLYMTKEDMKELISNHIDSI